MMIRCKNFRFGFDSCRRYFSNNLKNELTSPRILTPIQNSTTGGEESFDVDLFVNSILKSHTQSDDIFLNYLKWRQIDEKSFNLANAAVWKHFLEQDNYNDIIDVLNDREHNGIYLDKYVGCYLMDFFMQDKNNTAALQIVIHLMNQEDLSDSLVAALSAKACYFYISDYVESTPSASNVKKNTEKKIRVRYLNNTNDNELLNLAGHALLRICPKLPLPIYKNLEVLGLLARNEEGKNIDSINIQTDIIFEDVIKLCNELVTKMHNPDGKFTHIINGYLEKPLKQGNFAEEIIAFAKKTIEAEEPLVIEKQNKLVKLWSENYKDFKCESSRKNSKDLVQNYKNSLLTELDKNEERLWFFKMEDKIDLDIYRKKVNYPKRWFGKRKNPKFVEDSYVPPDIRSF